MLYFVARCVVMHRPLGQTLDSVVDKLSFVCSFITTERKLIENIICTTYEKHWGPYWALIEVQSSHV